LKKFTNMFFREMRTFDAIFIGTSPVMILEALQTSLEGKSVLMIDRRDSLGGAWHTAVLGSFKGIEIGCHYIKRYRKGYAFLEELIGRTLPVMDPQPCVQFWKCQFDHAQRSPAEFSLCIKNIRERKYRSFFSHLFRSIHFFWQEYLYKKQWDSPFCYPKEGCAEMIKALQRLLDASSIEIIHGRSVHEIYVEKNKKNGVCHTDQDDIFFRECVISSCTNLQTIHYPKKNIVLEKIVRSYDHVVLHIHGKKAQPFHYMEVRDNRYFSRVSDVGFCNPSFKKHGKKNELLLCVQIPANHWSKLQHNEKAFSDILLIQLEKKKLLQPGGNVLAYWSNRYETPFMDDHELDRIEKEFYPAIRTMKTTDMGTALARYADQWSSVLLMAHCIRQQEHRCTSDIEKRVLTLMNI